MRTNTGLLFLLCSLFLLTNASRKEHILDANTVRLNQIKVIPSKNKVFLPNKFGSRELKKLERLEKLEGRVVLGVDFVYTSYAEASSFEQRELNRKRLKELKSELPRLIEDPTIEWRKVVQTGASSPEEGRDYFHGFRITLRPGSDKASLEKERKYLRETVSGDDPFSEIMKKCSTDQNAPGKSSEDDEREETKRKKASSKRETDTISGIDDYTEASASEIAGIGPKAKSTPFGTAPSFEGGRFKFFNYLSKQIRCPKKEALKEQGKIEMVKASFLVSPSGAILAPAVAKKEDPCADSIKKALGRMPYWEPGLHEGKPVLTQVILNLNFSKASPSTFIDTIKRVTFDELGGKDSSFYSSSSMDRVHGKSFSYPFFSAGGYDPSYIEGCGVLEILERNQERWKDILVVCDVTGSMSPYMAQLLLWYKKLFDEEGTVEKVYHMTLFDDSERIYQQSTGSFDKLKNFFLNAFGGGGDTPENNVEGLIEGIKEAPKAKDIVMIADNYATPHDMELLPKLDREVHVILCGTRGGVNPAYIDFARRNGGSLHTIEADLRDISDQAGRSITLQGEKYILKKSGVKRVY